MVKVLGGAHRGISELFYQKKALLAKNSWEIPYFEIYCVKIMVFGVPFGLTLRVHSSWVIRVVSYKGY